MQEILKERTLIPSKPQEVAFSDLMDKLSEKFLEWVDSIHLSKIREEAKDFGITYEFELNYARIQDNIQVTCKAMIEEISAKLYDSLEGEYPN